MPTTEQIEEQFKALDGGTQNYFEFFQELVSLIKAKKCSWDIVIAYLFSKTEQAHNIAIYGGLVNIHSVNAKLARIVVDEQHMTREKFNSLYKHVFGTKIPNKVTQKVLHATKVRDTILHGGKAAESPKRKAVLGILEYAESFNPIIDKRAGFMPFASPLTGHIGGRGKGQHKVSTSGWILKGMGFNVESKTKARAEKAVAKRTRAKKKSKRKSNPKNKR